MPDPATPGELKLLIDAAGRRPESWRRLQDTPGEVYSCDTAELHEKIVIEFTREYVRVEQQNMELIYLMSQGAIIQEWAKRSRYVLSDFRIRRPIWMKRGSISTSNSVLAIIIPLPFETCETRFQPNKHDATNQVATTWPAPVLLPQNSALLLVQGHIKFIVIDVAFTVDSA